MARVQTRADRTEKRRLPHRPDHHADNVDISTTYGNNRNVSRFSVGYSLAGYEVLMFFQRLRRVKQFQHRLQDPTAALCLIKSLTSQADYNKTGFLHTLLPSRSSLLQ